MATAMDPREFVLELVNQLFHADVLVSEQAERIDAVEAEVARLQQRSPTPDGAAAYAAALQRRSVQLSGGFRS
jgi:hypothetical protein